MNEQTSAMTFVDLPPDVEEFLKTHEIERCDHPGLPAIEFRIGDSRLAIDTFKIKDSAGVEIEVGAWIRELVAAEAPKLADLHLER